MEDITSTLRENAEKTLNDRQQRAQRYSFLNEALFKIKDPEYTSPYENIGQKTTRLFNNQELQDIYDTLSPMYKSLADYGNPNDEQKKEMAAVKLATVFGTDYETAKKLTTLYYPMYAERDFGEKGYGTRLWNAIQSAYYNDMIGYNSTIATLFNSKSAKKRADNYYEKMMKVRNWQDFGAVGNFFTDNMQGIYSMGKMALVSALTGGVGTAIGASSKAIAITSGVINTLDSGATQMGSNVYMMSKMTDDNGNPLFDFDNVNATEKVLFTLSAGLMGAIETLEFETFNKVLPKSIRNSFATAKATKIMNEAFLKNITLNGAKTTALGFAKNVGRNILGEGIEEVLQQFVGNAFESLEADIQNTRGASFGEEYSLDSHITEGVWDSFWGGVKGSVLASLLSVGTGTFLNNRAIRQAQKALGQYQTKTDTSATIFTNYVRNTNDYNFSQEEINKRAEEIKQGKTNPIQTYKADNFGLYADSDGVLTLKALGMINPSLNIAEVEIADKVLHDISTEQQRGRFARQFNGGIYEEDKNSFYFDSKEDLETAKQTIAKIRGVELNNNTIKVETTNGDQTFSLKTIDEIEDARAEKRKQYLKENEAEIYPLYRHFMIFTNEEYAKVEEFIKNNNIAREEKETEALKSFLAQIYSITKKGKDANVDNFLGSINIITDENESSKASIDIATEPNENGYRQATIHLTKDSTFNSITHELNHYLQNNADIEDLRGFETAYKIDLSNREVWNEQVSKELKEKRGIKNDNYTYAELFANDAIKYYREGTAENNLIKLFFSKMKRALSRLTSYLKKIHLDEKTTEAFDKLFGAKTTQEEIDRVLNETIEDFDFEELKESVKVEFDNLNQKNYSIHTILELGQKLKGLGYDVSDITITKLSFYKSEWEEVKGGIPKTATTWDPSGTIKTKFKVSDAHHIVRGKNGNWRDVYKSARKEEHIKHTSYHINGEEQMNIKELNVDSKLRPNSFVIKIDNVEDPLKLAYNLHKLGREDYCFGTKNFERVFGKDYAYGYTTIPDFENDGILYDKRDRNFFTIHEKLKIKDDTEKRVKEIKKIKNEEERSRQYDELEQELYSIKEMGGGHFFRYKDFEENFLYPKSWDSVSKIEQDTGVITYHETEEENTNEKIFTKEDVKEIKKKDWILPPREEIKEVDEDIAFNYNTIDYWRKNGLDLVEKAKEIKEEYELTQGSEVDINGNLTEEDLQEINRIKESNGTDAVKEEQVDNQLRYAFKQSIKKFLNGNITFDFSKVLDYVWKLADITTEKEANTEFIYKYASDYDGLFTLIRTLNKANVKIKEGAMIQLYNEYKGVAEDILQLKKNSPKARLKEALTTIQNDPKSYRIAFEDATDIINGITAIDKREYDRSIRDEMLEYLGKKEENDDALTETEMEEKAAEDLANIRNLSNLKNVKKEDRDALKRSEERLEELQKDYSKISKKDKKAIEDLQKKIREQQAKTEKERQRIADYLVNEEIGRRFKKAKELSKFSEKSHSIKGASSFYWVRLKYLDKVGTNEYLQDLDNLERANKVFGTDYSLENPSPLMKILLKINGLENKDTLESVEDYRNLNSLLRDLRKVARLQLKEDENKRRAIIFETRKQAYNEAYGENGKEKKGEDFTMSFFDKGAVRELNERINSIGNFEEREDLKAKLRKGWDKLFLATAHPAQIARYIDKATNGTWQTLIEKLKQSETALDSSKIERFRNIQNEIENLMGFDAKYLLHNKGKVEAYLTQKTNEKDEKYIVKLNNGEIKELTRNEALMIYGYAIQDKGMVCLISEIGNNFTRESVENLIDNLISDKDKKLVDLLSKDLSSKDLDIARVYARQNNKIYNTLENYFPLYASQGSFQTMGVDESGMGLRTTLHNNSNYVNKSFTKERTSKVYALKLDLWNNYIRGVDSQERYIYQSDWVRDAQNWISPRGMGTFLARERGKLWTTTIKELINDIAEPQRKVNELNGFMSKAFSNMMIANLMFNTVSAIKQVGAWFAVFTDPDFNLSSFCKAIADLTFRHKQTVDNILEANPSIDLQKGEGLDLFDERYDKSKWNRGVETFKEWGLKMADFMDLQGRYVVWQSAYQSYIDKHGLLDENGKVDGSKIREAIRKADRIIEETQNSVKRSQLSSIQTKSGFLASDKLAYTNSDFQYLNKLFDTYILAKEKDIKGILGHLALIIFNGAFMTLLSGVLFKPTDYDKEKEKEKTKEIGARLANDILSGFVPFSVDIGTLIGKKQYFSNSSVFDLTEIPSRINKVIKDCREQEETKVILADLLRAIGEFSRPAVASPKVMIDRLAKGITDKDSTSPDKTTLNVLINLILGTGFYNNVRGR